MTHKSTLRSAVCFAALVSGNAAFADVTAQQVWDDWKIEMEMFGGDVTTTSEDLIGDTLTVRDLTLTTDEDGISSTLTIDQLIFDGQDDGSVRITTSDSYPLVITEEDGAVITVLISHPGLEMTVSGTPEALDYALQSDRFTVALQDIVNGEDTFTADMQLVGNNMSGTYSTRLDEMRNTSYDVQFDSFDLLVDVQPPDKPGEYVTGGGKVNGISVQADITMPLDADMADPDDLIASGMAVAGGYTVDSSEFVFDFNIDDGQGAGSFSAGAASLTAQISDQSVSYITNSNDIAVSVTAADLPFPIDVSLAEYGITFEMPLGQAETPQPFALGVDLVDLTLSDMIWSLFDPDSVLPRDPATVQIGLSGLARPLFDMLDPAQEEAMMASDLPFELDSVDLTQFNLAIAGATATGEGAFTFDNDDLTTFAPYPRPEGAVSVTINGLNALLDNLVTMGLIPEQDLMGPRMMMGMFARSTGDDQLETNLEVTPDGQVLANGQRIR
ncbi:MULTISPECIES: DUF2125 domain-containing protein [unclassified Yoonia]|uniref:DUF2125 domain-containing protein n=1 Tax=unclassified Yoonia TaxID=2629118 RepID=UPI002AFE156D|nr:MULTISPECIES: DUF2125 domain-containing protein [unclassified Yoonia]